MPFNKMCVVGPICRISALLFWHDALHRAATSALIYDKSPTNQHYSLNVNTP